MQHGWIKPARIAGIALGAVLGTGLLLFIFAGTSAGLNTVARLAETLTGGNVGITGLSGQFPNSLRAARVEIRDGEGAWLVLEDVAVDWSPFALIGNHVDIARLEAQRVQVLRLPMDDGSEDSTLRIDIGALDFPSLETAAAVSRTPMVFQARGRLHYASLRDLGMDLSLTQRGAADSYRANGTVKDGVANGTFRIDESPGGLIAGLLDLNDIGPIKLDARAAAAPDANRISVTLDAGQLHATGEGALDLPARRADIGFSAKAPAMTLRPDLSWESLAADGQLRGAFAEIAIDARLDVERLRAGDGTAERLTADVRGTNGAVDFTGTATGLRLADIDSGIFSRDPIELTGHAEFGEPSLPVRFTLSHPLVSADGNLELGDRTRGNVTLRLPRLEPLAALGGVAVAGRATFSANFEFVAAGLHLALDGTVAAAEDASMPARLLGPNARVAVEADFNGSDFAISRARLEGAGVTAQLSGQMRNAVSALDLTLALPELSMVRQTLKGDARIAASLRGPMRTARLEATATGNIATEGFSEQRVTLALSTTGFPNPSTGTFRARGNFNDAPVSLEGTLNRRGRVLDVSVMRGDWKSLHAQGDVALSDGAPISGRASLHLDDLQDLAPVLGRSVAGSADATVDFQQREGRATGSVTAMAMGLRLEGASVDALTVAGDIVDPAGDPEVALDIKASGIAVQGFAGDATARVSGQTSALAIALDAKLRDANGRPASLAGAASFDTGADRLRIASLTANYREQTAVLRGPSIIAFGAETAVQNFAADIGGARLTLNGRISPTLKASASLQNVTAKSLASFLPLSQGIVSATADLTGTFDAPEGVIDMQGRDLRLTSVSAGIAAAGFDARAVLNGQSMSVDAVLTAGPSTRMTVTGIAPLAAGRTLDLRAEGSADLAILNPILSAEGRNLRGQFALDAGISGAMANPRITGTARLEDGEIQDNASGVRVRNIVVDTRFEGNTVRIVQMSGRAGPGTISGSGTLDLAANGMPFDLKFEARNARPIATDRLHADLDADIGVTGQMLGRRTISGTIDIRNGETILPDSFPPQVVALTVRRPGDAIPAQQSAPQNGALNLDLTIRSPGRFFVRGRGLEAELQGETRIGGTGSEPVIDGGLTMRRGTLELAGQTIVLTAGKVTFDGAGLRNRIDPTLDFAAETASGGVTAKLEVTGYASAPRIQLSSTPPLPQDEILARLLFRQSVKELSPFQLAEIAQAAASLSGLGSGFNPLASVRRSLGLDRLSVGSATNSAGTGTQTTIEAGKYIAPNVYVGAKQGLANTTQAEAQIDLTDNLKAKATVNIGTNATVTQGSAQQELGSSVGLSYQFEY
jgi:translocation and assembly module TamB